MAEINTLNTQSAAKIEPPQSQRCSFEQDATRVLGRLQHALADVLSNAPEEIRKAADVERVFEVDHRLGWQVYRIVHASNPMAAGKHVPARVSVERLAKMASRKGVNSHLVEETTSAFDDFEKLVKQYAGTRGEFDALVASAIPEEQERFNLESREALYNAARAIRGVSVQTSHVTHILHPSRENPDRLDALHLSGNFGMQLIRRGTVVQTSLWADRTRQLLRTVGDDPVSDTTDVLLHQFCSDPQPTIRIHRGEQQLRFVMDVQDVGIQAAVSAVFAVLMPAYRSRFASAELPLAGVAHETDAPARWQVMDILLHESLMTDASPTVEVYDMVPHGQLSKIPDPDRVLDRVAFKPKVRRLGRGLTNFRCLHLPKYQEMLAHVCKHRGWDISGFDGYRVEIEFPVYSWQSVLAVELQRRA